MPGSAGGMPPSEMMGLFGLISGLAQRERMTPMDDMKKVISLLERIREQDPERTGANVSMALSVLRNGPECLEEESDES